MTGWDELVGDAEPPFYRPFRRRRWRRRKERVIDAEFAAGIISFDHYRHDTPDWFRRRRWMFP